MNAGYIDTMMRIHEFNKKMRLFGRPNSSRTTIHKTKRVSLHARCTFIALSVTVHVS